MGRQDERDGTMSHMVQRWTYGSKVDIRVKGYIRHIRHTPTQCVCGEFDLVCEVMGARPPLNGVHGSGESDACDRTRALRVRSPVQPKPALQGARTRGG
jgi:hypothetical protein